MTEEMAVQETTAPSLMRRPGSLFFDVVMFEHVQRVAQVFAKSDMVPDHFKNNIPNCIIGLNLAERMGVDPFMLFQNMYIVHGNPGIEAKLAIALTNGCGRFEPLQFKQENKGKGDSWECVAYAKDLKSGKVLESAAVSIQMAKNEGWYGKKGSKWQTMPELMLEYRSAMFFARVYCPEVLLGLKTREEIYDIVDLEPGRNGTYGTPEQKAADLTEKIKEKPNYAAKDLKPKDESPPKPTVDPVNEEEPGPTPLEQGEPQGILPDGVDPIGWLLTSRGKSSPTNADLVMKVFKAEEKNIESQSDEIKAKLRRKYKDVMDYLSEILHRQKEIAEEEPPIPDEDRIPAFEKNNEPDEANGRMQFINKMRGYMDTDHEKYRTVMDKFEYGGVNDVPQKKVDEDFILGCLEEAFTEG